MHAFHANMWLHEVGKKLSQSLLDDQCSLNIMTVQSRLGRSLMRSRSAVDLSLFVTGSMSELFLYPICLQSNTGVCYSSAEKKIM